MGDRLFGRAYTVIVGEPGGLGFKISTDQSDHPLRVDCDIVKSTKPQPNKSTIKLYNLNDQHVETLEKLGGAAVQIEAGYKNATSLIFLGIMRRAVTVREGPDRITTIGGGDGELHYRNSRINQAFAKGTPTDEVFRKVAKSLGVGDGNLAQAAATIRTKFANEGSAFSLGTVLTGNSAREMSAICRSLNLEWSIQNGKLQILERGKALAGEAIKLGGPDGAGLIGTPSLDSKGVLACQSLCVRDAYPGRLLVLDAERLKGQFKITDTHHVLNYYSPTDWRIEYKAEKY